MLFAALPLLSVQNPVDTRPAFLVLLVRPENPAVISAEEGQKIQTAHLAHLTKMWNDGYAKVAGPFMVDQRIRGIVVMRAESEAKAKHECEQDPAVKANRLAVEIYPWSLSRTQFGPSAEPFKLAQQLLVLVERKGDVVEPSWTRERMGFFDAFGPRSKVLMEGEITSGNYLDMFVIDTMDKESVEAAVKRHPAVRRGFGNPVVLPWGCARGVLN